MSSIVFKRFLLFTLVQISKTEMEEKKKSKKAIKVSHKKFGVPLLGLKLDF